MQFYNHSLFDGIDNGNKTADADQRILNLILEALKDEKMDYDYYGKLKGIVTDTNDKAIIEGVQLDEQKHYMLLSDIYYKLTGHSSVVETDVKPVRDDAVAEYAKSILSELNGQEFYRKLYFAFMDVRTRDIIFEIMADEGEHAAKFNFLFAKNKQC